MAETLVATAQSIAGKNASPKELWSVLHRELLTPQTPFEVHKQCYQLVYPSSILVKPCWIAKEHELATTNVTRTMNQLGFSTYDELYEYSIQHRDQFWMQSQQAIGIEWEVPPTAAFTSDNNTYYYPGGRINICNSILKESSNHQPAIMYGSHPDKLHSVSVQELTSLVNQVANAIAMQYQQGTRIAVCLPLSVEAVAIYLGILKAGCVVVSIADSFASHEIATRCQIANVSCVVTQDVIQHDTKTIPLYNRVVQAMMELGENNNSFCSEEKKDETGRGTAIPIVVVVVHNKNNKELHESVTLRSIDVSYNQFVHNMSTEFDAVIVDSMEPANILFSSGTTGTPKAIVWSHCTLIKCAVDGYYHQDLHNNDRLAWPTSLGWMMGSWLIAQRINNVTICLFQGLPHSKEFAQFVEAARVTVLGVIPSLVQTWQARNSVQHADWSNVRLFSSTGEASDPDNYLWLSSRVKGYAPIIEYCGGTEIGGSFLSSVLHLSNVPSMFNTPVLGTDLRLLHDGTVFDNDKDDIISGELALIPPSIGWSVELLNRNHHDCYFSGMPVYKDVVLRRHGDEFQKIGQYYRALGRCDDTMNLGGIKVSCVELERVCNTLGCVKETAAIAIGQPNKLVIYAVLLKKGMIKDLKQQFQGVMKVDLNPLFSVFDVVVTESLPRTASNKVMRRLLRDEYVQN